MRKMSYLEDVWGIYTELKNSLGEEYSDEQLLGSANRIIEVAKGKIAKEKTNGMKINQSSAHIIDTYTMMTRQPLRETKQAIDDFCDFEDDDFGINYFSQEEKFKAYGLGL